MKKNQDKKMKGILMVILLILTGGISTSILIPNVESTFTYNVHVFQSYNELFNFYRDIASNENSHNIGFNGWYLKNGAGFRAPEALNLDTSYAETSASSSEVA